MSYYSYQPENGHGLPHDPLAAILGPRPIGWISTRSVEGRDNLAPYSFFSMFNYRPPILGFSSVGWKDTVRNISESGEFIFNLVTRQLADLMNQTSASVEESEFEITGLERLQGSRVRAARVAASPVSIECKLSQLVRLQDLQGQPIDTWMILGVAIAVHIRRDFLEEGIYQTAKAGPVLRAGGAGDYFQIAANQGFFMKRPK